MREKEDNTEEQSFMYAIRKQKILVDLGGSAPDIPRFSLAGDLGVERRDGYNIGKSGECECLAFSVRDEAIAPHGMKFIGVRAAFAMLDKANYSLAVRALGIISWDRACRHCTSCGGKLARHDTLLAKNCTVCGFTMFPKISPAVIVLVEKDDKVLLARSSRFAENLYSVLAGFAEPGESLEDVVRREVKEEVGIEVKNIRYFGSQPWPYPDSLMIGFTAVWAGGEIAVDNDEISDAQWFSVENMPNIPDKVSIARELIDWFLEKHR